MIDISSTLAVLTLGNIAGLSPALLHILLLYQIEVDVILADFLAIGALYFEMPVSLCRLLDASDIF